MDMSKNTLNIKRKIGVENIHIKILRENGLENTQETFKVTGNSLKY